jgi:hypothetical protein
MKLNPYSTVVREQLAAIGFAQIPPTVIEFIEAQMARELAKIAARKIDIRFVSKSISKALSPRKNASKSTQNASENPKPTA